MPEGPTEQFLRRSLEITAVGAVHERVRSVGEKAADQFRLILDDRAIAGFAFTKRVLLAAPFFDHGSKHEEGNIQGQEKDLYLEDAVFDRLGDKWSVSGDRAKNCHQCKDQKDK